MKNLSMKEKTRMQNIMKVLALGTVAALAVGTAGAQTGTLQGRQLFLYDNGTGANLNRISLQTPSDVALTANYGITLPATAGTLNQLLVNQGSGVLDWSSTLTLSGLTVTGALVANGNVTLGDAPADVITVNGTMGFPGLTAGLPLQLNGSGQLVGLAIDLNTGSNDISGTLSVPNGGTGATTFTTNGVLYGNGTSAVGATAAGTAGQVLVGTAGAPAWSATPTVSSITLSNTTNQLVLGTGNTTTINSPAPGASRTYTIPDAGADASFVMTEGAQTINGTKTIDGALTPGTGSITANRFVGTGSTSNAVDLATGEVGGILPVANGGSGVNTFTQFALVVGDNANPLAQIPVGATGELLVGNSGANPSWTNSPSITALTVNTLTVNTTANLLGTTNLGDNNGDVINVVGALAPAGGGTVQANQFVGTGSTSNAVDLATGEVGGILPVANGGTGVNTFTQFALVVGDNANPLAQIPVGATGELLVGNTGANPSWTNSPTITALTVNTLTVNTTANLNGTTNLGDANGDAINVVGTLAPSGGGTVQANRFVGTGSTSNAVDLATGEVGGILPVTNGGTGLNAVATGDILYGSAANTLSALGIGAAGEYLGVTGGIPDWKPLSSDVWVLGGNTANVDATNNILGINFVSVDPLRVFASSFERMRVTPSGEVVVQNYDVTGSSRLRIVGTAAQGTTNLLDIQNSALNFIVRADVFGGTTARLLIGDGTLDGHLRMFNGAAGGVANIVVQSTLGASRTYTIPTIEGDGRYVVADAAGTAGQLLQSNGDGNRSTWTSSPSISSLTVNTLTVNTTANLNGTTNLGDANGDAINVIGTLAPSGGGTVTANQFVGTGSTTNAVDLGTGEVAGILPVGNGGTGQSSFTANGVIYGNGGSGLLATAVGAAGEVFVGTGAAPAWSGSPTLSGTLAVQGATNLGNGDAGDVVTINTGGLNNLAISETGILRVGQIDILPGTGNIVNTDGGLTVAENLTVNGNSTLGNAGTDQVTINAATVGAPNLNTTTTTANVLVRNAGNIEVSTATFATTAGALTANAPVRTNGSGQLTTGNTNLASEVTGTLPVGNGGTGQTSFTANGVIYGNSTSGLLATGVGATGEIFVGTGAAPAWSGSPTLSGNLGVNGNTTLGDLAADQVTINAATVSAANLPTTTTTANVLVRNAGNIEVSTATFATTAGALTANAPVRTNGSGQLTTGNTNLASEVTGTLPVGNGGTGSTSYTGDRVVVSNAAGNALVSLTPQTANQILVTTSPGNVPSWSSSLPSGVTISFSDVTSGTSTGTLLVSGSLAPTGGGSITASRFVGTGSTSDAVDLGTGEVAGILPVANGGTGLSTAPINSILYASAANTYSSLTPGNNQVLTSNGSGVPTWVNGGVVPAGLTANSPVRTDGSGNLTTGNTNLASEVTGTLPVANGGTGSTSYTGNSVIVSNAGGTALTSLTPGASQVLVSTAGSVPTFASALPTGVTISFSDVTTGSSTGTLTVGAGGSLAPVGGGTITANQFIGTGSTSDAVDLGTGEVAGIVAVGNGGTGLSTAPINSILYASAANTYSSLTPGNNQVLTSNGSGVPTWVNGGVVPVGLTANSPVRTDGSGNLTTGNTNLASEVTGTLPIANGGTGLTSAPAADQILIGVAGAYALRTLQGTANRVSVTVDGSNVTLSAPQDIHSGASPTFAGLTLTANLSVQGNTTLGNQPTDEITHTGTTVNTASAQTVTPTVGGASFAAFTGTYQTVTVDPAPAAGAHFVDLPAGTTGQVMYIRISCNNNTVGGGPVTLRQPDDANTAITWANLANNTYMLHMIYDGTRWAILSSVLAPF